jgi:ABC-type multidrug transport system fused ATPase/permease subunit
MVLDAGNLVEFASPRELLSNEASFFRALVDQSNDREALYSMAGARL